MTEIQLHPDIENLETNDPGKFAVYQTLLQGMKEANDTTPPDYSQPPYSIDTGKTWVDPDGNVIPLLEPNEGAIAAKMAEISEIQMQNSAYLFARVIGTTSGTGGGGVDITKFVQRNGDSMLGLLGALRGFEAGINNTKIFDVTINAADENIAHVYGSLLVDDDVTVGGTLNLSNDGIYFSKHQSIYYDDNILKFDAPQFSFNGDVEFTGNLTIGDIQITQTGITWGNNEFYHSGNSNNSVTDWSMKDGHIYGNLVVDGDAQYDGRLCALKGFDLGENGEKLFYSVYDENSKKAKIELATDIDIVAGYGIKFEDQYILRVRSGNENIVSLSAPGKTLNLGDSGEKYGILTPTSHISLQADIKNDKSTFTMISANGDGYFPNSFRAGCANGGPTVIETFYDTKDYCGVVIPKTLVFGKAYGPSLSSTGTFETLTLNLPCSYNDGNDIQAETHTMTFRVGESNYPWRKPILTHDASLILDTDCEYFIANKPILSKSFAILNTKYQTRLEDNALFLNTNTFIEGVESGMSFTGNAYFNHDISSRRFASGMAGYGWGIIKDPVSGSYAGTLDELTVRKKMRIYELEVQKQNVTNGSWWVTDSCSGDTAEEFQWQS